VSATGRNLAGHERHPDDDYATPAWCTRAIMPHLTISEGIVLDPCCGVGAILDVFHAAWPNRLTKGIEFNEERHASAKCKKHVVFFDDALSPSCVWPSCDAIVTNPPYNLALPFIEKAIRSHVAKPNEQSIDVPYDSEPSIDLAFLLRLNFLGSQKRADFHRAHPCDVFVLPRRPSFTGGGTDATEYAWFVWGQGRGNRWFMLDVEGAR
jgi:hypothetical protein